MLLVLLLLSRDRIVVNLTVLQLLSLRFQRRLVLLLEHVLEVDVRVALLLHILIWLNKHLL